MKSVLLVSIKYLSKIKEDLKLLDSSFVGQGTYIRTNTSPSKWAYVAIRISPSESRYHMVTFLENTIEFPESYKTEITEVVDAFALIYTFWTGEIANFKFEITDAVFKPAETTYNDFYMATVNAILNAFNSSLHIPELEKVNNFKSS